MSALQDEIRAAVREVVREELRLALAVLSPPAPDGNRLVGVADAADRLGLSIKTLYKRAAAIEIPSVKTGARLLFRVADLDAYAEAHRRSPESVKRKAAELSPE